jgi:hypothetical protein
MCTGVNKFTDMCDSERKQYLGFSLGKRLSQALDAAPVELPPVDVDALPASVDWRTRRPAVVTPVKDQGKLSCCVVV